MSDPTKDSSFTTKHIKLGSVAGIMNILNHRILHTACCARIYKEYRIIHTITQKSYIFVRVVKVMAAKLSEQEIFQCNVSSVESVCPTDKR